MLTKITAPGPEETKPLPQVGVNLALPLVSMLCWWQRAQPTAAHVNADHCLPADAMLGESDEERPEIKRVHELRIVQNGRQSRGFGEAVCGRLIVLPLLHECSPRVVILLRRFKALTPLRPRSRALS